MKTSLSAAMLLLLAAGASAQTATMPAHTSTFSGSVRGYYFTAPVDFTITGVNVLLPPSGTGSTNTTQNFAIVRFDNATPPPLFSATTNAFIQLALEFDHPVNTFHPVEVEVFAGDVIGIYGVTADGPGSITNQNSYGNAPGGNTTDILGNNVQLFRSGMQFRLNTTNSPNGMHDIWAEGTANTSNITRIEFTYTDTSGCYANCDASTTEPVLNVDDFTCFINEFAAAQSLPHEQQVSSYANCDGSTFAPALNVDDFTCFINEFAQGCP